MNMTAKQCADITKSIRGVMETRSIEHLSKLAYQFIIENMGFIAHTSLDGFRGTYADLRLFCRKLQTGEYSDDPEYTIREAKRYETMDALKENSEGIGPTIRGIVALARKHEQGIAALFNMKQRAQELITANHIAEKYGYKLVKAVSVNTEERVESLKHMHALYGNDPDQDD